MRFKTSNKYDFNCCLSCDEACSVPRPVHPFKYLCAPTLPPTISHPSCTLELQLPAKYKKVGETEPDEISLEEAIELLEAKRAKDPAAASRGGRVSASKSNDKSSGSGKKKQASGSPRPLTGFMRFCQDCRLSHAAAGDAQTGSSGAPTRLTASDLSVKWKALSEEQRAGYNAASAADRAEWKAKEARETWAAGNGGGDTPAGFDLTGYDMYCEDNSFKTPSEYESLKDGWGSLTVDEQKELDERAVSADYDLCLARGKIFKKGGLASVREYIYLVRR